MALQCLVLTGTDHHALWTLLKIYPLYSSRTGWHIHLLKTADKAVFLSHAQPLLRSGANRRFPWVHLASDDNSSGSHNHLILWLDFTRCANVSFLLSHRASDWRLDFQTLGCSWHCCDPYLIPNEMLSSREWRGTMADAGLKTWPCLFWKKPVSPGILWCENRVITKYYRVDNLCSLPE